jgi:hypothetical protein
MDKDSAMIGEPGFHVTIWPVTIVSIPIVWEVAEVDKRLKLNAQDMAVKDPIKSSVKVALSPLRCLFLVLRHKWPVVVSENQNLTTHETTDVTKRLVNRSKSNVSKVVNGVLRTNQFIPVTNKSLVHFDDTVEGTVTQFDNSTVTEVRVTGKPCSHLSSLVV